MLRVSELTKDFEKLSLDLKTKIINACLMAEPFGINAGGQLLKEKLDGLHIHCGSNHIAIAKEDHPGAKCYLRLWDVSEKSGLCKSALSMMENWRR